MKAPGKAQTGGSKAERFAAPLGHAAARAVLAAGETQLLKSDRRSRVWRVDAPGIAPGNFAGAWVVKRFEQPPSRQRLAWVTRSHPAQRERDRSRRMAHAGLPVVCPAALLWSEGRLCLVAPYGGESLQAAVRRGLLRDPRRRRPVLEQLASLLLALVEAGWFFRDCKIANVLIDERDRLRLIDVGSARQSRSEPHALRMAAMLLASLAGAGASRADCARLVRLILAQSPAGSAASDKRWARRVIALAKAWWDR